MQQQPAADRASLSCVSGSGPCGISAGLTQRCARAGSCAHFRFVPNSPGRPVPDSPVCGGTCHSMVVVMVTFEKEDTDQTVCRFLLS